MATSNYSRGCRSRGDAFTTRMNTLSQQTAKQSFKELTILIMLASGEEGHSRDGRKGPFSVGLKGPMILCRERLLTWVTHDRLFIPMANACILRACGFAKASWANEAHVQEYHGINQWYLCSDFIIGLFYPSQNGPNYPTLTIIHRTYNTLWETGY